MQFSAPFFFLHLMHQLFLYSIRVCFWINFFPYSNCRKSLEKVWAETFLFLMILTFFSWLFFAGKEHCLFLSWLRTRIYYYSAIKGGILSYYMMRVNVIFATLHTTCYFLVKSSLIVMRVAHKSQYSVSSLIFQLHCSRANLLISNGKIAWRICIHKCGAR